MTGPGMICTGSPSMWRRTGTVTGSWISSAPTITAGWKRYMPMERACLMRTGRKPISMMRKWWKRCVIPDRFWNWMGIRRWPGTILMGETWHLCRFLLRSTAPIRRILTRSRSIRNFSGSVWRCPQAKTEATLQRWTRCLWGSATVPDRRNLHGNFWNCWRMMRRSRLIFSGIHRECPS